jgi:hypothetical protein
VRPLIDESARSAGWWLAFPCDTVHDLTAPLLTERDPVPRQPPDLTQPHWRCGIVHGAPCRVYPTTNGDHYL